MTLSKSRTLAIDAAVHAIIRARIDPLLTNKEIHERSTTQVAHGFHVFTVTFDGKEIVRVCFTGEEFFLLTIVSP